MEQHTVELGIEKHDDVDGGLDVKVKRLLMELAVERNNCSVLTKELQQVGKERDEFMQKFTVVEQELRSHAVSQSILSTSSSTDAGDSARASSGHQRQLSITITK